MSGPDLLEAWHEHLSNGRRRSPHTVRAYAAAAARLVAATQAEEWPDIARLDGRALRGQLAARRAEGIGNASAARELSALKGFVAFAREQTGEADASAPRLRGPRIKKGLPRPVTPDEAENLAESIRSLAADEWIGARDRAVLLLMYGSGLRIAEALSLTASAVPLGETLTVTGKGGKTARRAAPADRARGGGRLRRAAAPGRSSPANRCSAAPRAGCWARASYKRRWCRRA